MYHKNAWTKICGLWRLNRIGKGGVPVPYWAGTRMNPEFIDKLHSFGYDLKLVVYPAEVKIKRRNGYHSPEYFIYATHVNIPPKEDKEDSQGIMPPPKPWQTQEDS